jgi:hypothetical protein
LGSHCSCRYSRPLAAPSAILFLVTQSSGGCPVVDLVKKEVNVLLVGLGGWVRLQSYPAVTFNSIYIRLLEKI